jgi:hypothetical protein
VAFVIDHVSRANLCDQDAIINPDVLKRNNADGVTGGNLRPARLHLLNRTSCVLSVVSLPAVSTVSKHLISFAKVKSSAKVNPKG